ncbi:hypothetical protein GCM10025873_07840 [Demequina sediminis]|uniref:hypothetical protein n=1 Tax=Demequina sediminis TaxID=1930058 RepID=UPI002573EB70|nr:hypothetical protein [Demequina sediminis]BDZ60993.1 hypothetical protein GCM10025873_07840 [Demequina sediminis]
MQRRLQHPRGVVHGGASGATLEGDITFLTNRTDLQENGTFDEYVATFQEEYP